MNGAVDIPELYYGWSKEETFYLSVSSFPTTATRNSSSTIKCEKELPDWDKLRTWNWSKNAMIQNVQKGCPIPSYGFCCRRKNEHYIYKHIHKSCTSKATLRLRSVIKWKVDFRYSHRYKISSLGWKNWTWWQAGSHDLRGTSCSASHERNIM